MRRVLGLLLIALAGCPRPTPAERPVRGEGDVLRSFLVRDVATGDHYCMVCRFAGRPTVMAVLDSAAPTLAADLAALEALRRRSERLTVFAVVGPVRGGQLRPAPAEDLARAHELQRTLPLGYPIGALPADPPPRVAEGYRPYAEGYDLSARRTVLYATADNRVRAALSLPADGADATDRILGLVPAPAPTE